MHSTKFDCQLPLLLPLPLPLLLPLKGTPMRLIISYDIVDNKRRTKLAKRLLNFGARVQYSVFECDLDAKQLAQLKKQVLPGLNLEEDSLRIYQICENCVENIQSFGVKKGWEEEDVVVI